MHKTCLAAAFVGFGTLSTASFAQGWIEYNDSAHLFSANFPGEPDVRRIEYRSEFDAVFPAYVYSVRNAAGYYAVTVVDFREAERIHREKPNRPEAAARDDSWIMDQRAAVARAAREFRQRGGEITYDAWAYIDRVEGHQLQIVNPDGSVTFAGMYMHGNVNRLYVLEATVPAGSPPPGLFQQSIRFVDGQGERVRYNITPNGCLTADD
jgi:hypothetical protein